MTTLPAAGRIGAHGLILGSAAGWICAHLDRLDALHEVPLG